MIQNSSSFFISIPKCSSNKVQKFYPINIFIAIKENLNFTWLYYDNKLIEGHLSVELSYNKREHTERKAIWINLKA